MAGAQHAPDESERQQQDHAEARQLKSPSGSVVYRAIYHEGETELDRGNSALAWSGLAAGLSMGFSFLAESLLRARMPEADWRPLVTKLGYSIGFLLVILGRQQLFTENTLTVVLPLLRNRSPGMLGNVLRLWAVVFLANLAGALLFASAILFLRVTSPETDAALRQVALEAVVPGFGTLVARAVFAGWLIAVMVWVLPFAETARVSVIVIVTYVIGIGQFTHVIAGATEAFYLALSGLVPWGSGAGRFLLAGLLGNTIGGTALVAAIAHVQYIQSGEAEDT
jgi:formate/nitrite transporter FocA (FNT family)